MSNEIKEFIDEELPPGTAPVSLDVETVMRTSQGTRKRRRLLGGGAAFLSVVAVVAVVMAAMSFAPANGDGSQDGAPPDKAEAAETDEPVLDPDKEYYWDGPEKSKLTDASRAYTKAFHEYLAKHHPEAVFVDSNDEGTEGRNEVTGDPAKAVFLGASAYTLYEGDQEDQMDHMTGEKDRGEALQRRTMMTLFERFEGGEGFNGTSCCGATLLYKDGKPKVDGFDIEIYPKDTYTRGTEDAMDPAWLGDDVTHKGDVSTGPDGEAVQTVAASMPDDVDGTVHTFQNAVIVYRTDGSAVAVRASSGTDRGGNVSDRLNFEDLKGIALALPDQPLD